MARKRDYLEEIFEKRQRATSMGRWDYTFLRYQAKDFSKIHAIEGGWLNFVPVRIVTTIEVFFQDVVKELVEHGEPFNSHVFKVIDIGKFDANLIKALHGQKISIGELASHLISVNRIDEIIAMMDRLMGIRFRDRLALTTDRWEAEVNGKAPVPIIENIDETIKTLDKLIDDRHTVVHEITSLSITPDVALRYVAAAYSFLHATNEIVTETLYPNAPLTQRDMTMEAIKDFGTSKMELRSFVLDLVKELRSKGAGQDRIRSLVRAYQYSERYVDEMASFESSGAEGGSIQSQIYAMAARRITSSFLADLKARYTDKYRDLL